MTKSSLSFLILFIRITGLDLNKFGFKNDKEFLELEQADREEFEVSVNIDKDAFKRGYKKVLRLIRYFYDKGKVFRYGKHHRACNLHDSMQQ